MSNLIVKSPSPVPHTSHSNTGKPSLITDQSLLRGWVEWYGIGMGWDREGWDGVGQGGVGCTDEMRCNAMRCAEMICDAMGCDEMIRDRR